MSGIVLNIAGPEAPFVEAEFSTGGTGAGLGREVKVLPLLSSETMQRGYSQLGEDDRLRLPVLLAARDPFKIAHIYQTLGFRSGDEAREFGGRLVALGLLDRTPGGRYRIPDDLIGDYRKLNRIYHVLTVDTGTARTHG